MMTFEQFQASGRDVADLREVLEGGHDFFEARTPGRVYAGGLYVETSGQNLYSLTIANQVFSPTADLASLERELYEYGKCEHAFDDTEQTLIDQLRDYCAAQGLPHESADDILAIHKLTEEQRAWLENFCARWNRVVG